MSKPGKYGLSDFGYRITYSEWLYKAGRLLDTLFYQQNLHGTERTIHAMYVQRNVEVRSRIIVAVEKK
jgi:hypothetical protein